MTIVGFSVTFVDMFAQRFFVFNSVKRFKIRDILKTCNCKIQITFRLDYYIIGGLG